MAKIKKQRAKASTKNTWSLSLWENAYAQLGLSFFIVVVSWLLLGWNPSLFPLSGDGFTVLASLHQYLVRHEVYSMMYFPHIVGGAQATPTFGYQGASHLFGFLGLGAGGTIVFSLFLSQSLMSVLSFNIFTSLSQSFSPNFKINAKVRPFWVLAFSLMCGFAPFISWRVTFGHFNLLMGTQFFIALMAIAVCGLSSRIDWKVLSLAVLAMAMAVPDSGHQLRYYTLTIGLPILIGLMASMKKSGESYGHLVLRALPSAMLALGAFLLVLPAFWNLLEGFLGGESARNSGGAAIYTYTTATVRDWLSSLPLSHQVIDYKRDQYLHHETNYPFGPLIIAFAVLAATKARVLFVALTGSLLLAFILANNVPGLANLLTAIPMMDDFRVPARAIIPFLAMLPVAGALGLSSLNQRVHSPSSPLSATSWATIIGLGAVGFFAETLYAEIALWPLVFLMVFRPQFISKHLSPLAILLLVGVVSLSAFRDRLQPMTALSQIIPAAQQLADKVNQATGHKTPFERQKLIGGLENLRINTSLAGGLSTIDGYFVPGQRYLNLLGALQGREMSGLSRYLDIPIQSTAFQVLQPLYNVTHLIKAVPESALQIQKLPPTAGPAWFSQRVIPRPSMKSLANELLGNRSNLANQLKIAQWVNKGDSAFKLSNLSLPSGVCNNASVNAIVPKGTSGAYEISVNSDGICPLTLATNYSRYFRAYANDRELTIYPAYGSLLGVIVPADVKTITIKGFNPRPGWVWIFTLLGVALIAFAAYNNRKNNEYGQKETQ